MSKSQFKMNRIEYEPLTDDETVAVFRQSLRPKWCTAKPSVRIDDE